MVLMVLVFRRVKVISSNQAIADNYDVVIIGSGPAGLATAIELKKLGVRDLIVLERYAEAGGNPRFCGHSPFGMREFKRIYSGPKYARKLVSTAEDAGVTIALNTTVISLGEAGALTLSTPKGSKNIKAKRVVLSTGIRELPRAPRFVSGQRPEGIVTTGALQSLVYANHRKPFKKPVIVGSELVSFSAIATCHHVGIKPVMMIENNQRVTAYKPLEIYPKILGIKIALKSRLIEILGTDKVTGVKIADDTGLEKQIDCDGVIFTGKFLPEASLVRSAHIEIDPNTQGPEVDQFNRCSDSSYFATGNILRPVETGGWCWSEGKQTAEFVKASLSEVLPNRESSISVNIESDVVQYVVPQRICFSEGRVIKGGVKNFQLRFKEEVASKKLSLSVNSTEYFSKKIRALPERRVLIPISEISHMTIKKSLKIECK